MKTLPNLLRYAFNILLTVLLVAVSVSCHDEPDLTTTKDATTEAARSSGESITSARSTGTPTDYNISLTVDGLIWTYVITKNPGAKDLSHFILNFQNCNGSSATLEDIVWATVNGEPAILESSEGNTGCNVSSVTTNLVKFDDLPAATSYTIVFQTNVRYGNFVGTTAWLKAGRSCFAYPVLAPCCPL